MRVLIDTNILLYAINKDAPQHRSAMSYLERFLNTGEQWCLTWANVYEFLSIVTHQKCMPKPLSHGQALEVVNSFLESPSLEILVETPDHQKTLQRVVKGITNAHGAFFYDCHIAALMQEHEVTMIATADTDFRKFPFLKVIDPTKSS